MGMPVVTVATGGLPVVESTNGRGTPVTEAANGRGVAVTKVTALGLPVIFVDTAGVVVPSSTTWDLATAVNVVLSNGNLTATHSTTTSNSGIKGKTSATSGQYYFEYTVTVMDVSSTFSIGLITTSGTFTNMIGSGVSCVCSFKTGSINSNDAASGKTIGTILVGNVVGVAVDLTARKAWLRKNGGNWNGLAIGSENPATGLGGVTVAPTIGLLPAVVFGSGNIGLTDAFTANFGATAYTNAAPSGFGNWPAS